jgi:hypothetical protein
MSFLSNRTIGRHFSDHYDHGACIMEHGSAINRTVSRQEGIDRSFHLRRSCSHTRVGGSELSFGNALPSRSEIRHLESRGNAVWADQWTRWLWSSYLTRFKWTTICVNTSISGTHSSTKSLSSPAFDAVVAVPGPSSSMSPSPTVGLSTVKSSRIVTSTFLDTEDSTEQPLAWYHHPWWVLVLPELRLRVHLASTWRKSSRKRTAHNSVRTIDANKCLEH